MTIHQALVKLFFFALSCTLFFACQSPGVKSEFTINPKVNWTLTVPEGFTKINNDEWAIMQDKGAEAIEETFEEPVQNGSQSVFVFNSGEKNFFESNLVELSQYEVGAYALNYKESNQILCQTFKSQMPGIKIDTVTFKERIAGIEFHKFKMKVYYPNAEVLNIILYNRLFDNQELAVNIMYTDDEKGAAILNSWRNSHFSVSK